MKNRQYQGVQLSKKESELIQWLQKGRNDYTQAFYEYKGRRKPRFLINGRTMDGQKERSWFNGTLKRLKYKGLCDQVPFAFAGLPWFNPGVTHDSKQLKTEAIKDDFQEHRITREKIVG